MSNRAMVVVVAAMCVIVVVGVLLIAPALRKLEPKPQCVCESTTCAACPAAVECPPPAACPPTVTKVEVLRREFSAALADVRTSCTPALEAAQVKTREALAVAHAKLEAAKQAGVTSRDFSWLDDEDARAAAADLLVARDEENFAADDLWTAILACRHGMEETFASTESWLWVDSGVHEDLLQQTRQFEEEILPVLGFELSTVWCNVAARRMECKEPRPLAPGDERR